MKVGHTSEFPFGIYCWTLKNQKNQNFENMKKKSWRYHHFTHVYQKLESYELEFLRYRVRQMFLVIWGHFLPLTTQKTKILKNEKSIWRCHDIKFVQQKTRSNGVCHFMGHFLPSDPFNNPKSQNFEKIKKMPGDNIIFLFRTTMTIMWCMVPEISSRTDIIFCHFGPFFVLLPLEISLFYTREDGWCKKDKKIDWNTSFLKKVHILQNQI